MSCPFDTRPADITAIYARLKSLSSAEEFFSVLNVRYEAEVLGRCRLHILKRMGEYLAGDDLEGLPDSIAAARARAFLERAYEDFAASSPLEQRVFKVLKDHDPKRPVAPGRAFVALDDILKPVEGE